MLHFWFCDVNMVVRWLVEVSVAIHPLANKFFLVISTSCMRGTSQKKHESTVAKIRKYSVRKSTEAPISCVYMYARRCFCLSAQAPRGNFRPRVETRKWTLRGISVYLILRIATSRNLGRERKEEKERQQSSSARLFHLLAILSLSLSLSLSLALSLSLSLSLSPHRELKRPCISSVPFFTDEWGCTLNINKSARAGC